MLIKRVKKRVVSTLKGFITPARNPLLIIQRPSSRSRIVNTFRRIYQESAYIPLAYLVRLAVIEIFNLMVLSRRLAFQINLFLILEPHVYASNQPDLLKRYRCSC